MRGFCNALGAVQKGGALARREHARHGERSVRIIVEERGRPTEPAQPPAENPRCAEGENVERGRRRRVRRERTDGGALVDSAKRRAERLISRTAVSLVADERMNEAYNRKARAGSVADRGPATISVPAKDLVGEAQAAHRVHARGKLHATHWHLEDLGSVCCVEHVGPLEEARERLAVLAVADEAEAGVRRNFARDAAHAAALAAKREVITSRRGDIPIIACHQRPATGGAKPGKERTARRMIAFRCAVDVPLAMNY